MKGPYSVSAEKAREMLQLMAKYAGTVHAVAVALHRGYEADPEEATPLLSQGAEAVREALRTVDGMANHLASNAIAYPEKKEPK